MTTGMAHEQDPVFDEDDALRQCLGRMDLLRKVLTACSENLPRLEEALAAELAAEDRARLRKVAHTIKGAAGNISARRVFFSAEALEHVLQSGDERSVREKAELLERELLVLERAITEVLGTAEVSGHREPGI